MTAAPSTGVPPETLISSETDAARSRLPSLFYSALAGVLAFLLLTLVELVDVNIQLTPEFASPSERLVFAAYSSLSLLVGLLAGLAAGLIASSAGLLKAGFTRIIARGRDSRLWRSAVAGLIVVVVGGIVLNWQPRVHRYFTGLIREAEKTEALRNLLLNHERATAYLISIGLVLVCSLAWISAHRAGTLPRLLFVCWLILLAGIIAAGYYVDSRVQVQLYENSLHSSMYLLNVAAAMTLIGSLFSARARKSVEASSRRTPLRTVIFSLSALTAAGLVIFTFSHLGENQNLKTQLYFRTTHAKQNLKVLQWVLDYDRDGYSSLLDGGDSDDRRAEINPRTLEVIGDGLDNNCVSGDLTQAEVDEWRRANSALHPKPGSGAKRLNFVYIFIDTVRADHLGAYGYSRATTPNLDSLAARSILFEKAFTPSPRTADAVPKFMQSSYWDAHLPSWTEMLSGNGYNTMLFPGRRSWERYKRWMKVAPKAQGKPLKENVDLIIETLGRAPSDRPFCAFVYVPDPHRPYVKHDEFYFGESAADLYDGELAYTDHHLGRLIDWLDSSGRLRDTCVVVMSDHGESLGERGVFLHATQLYNEQTHIPMIFYAPDIAPRRVSAWVSSIDLGTTILGLAGIQPPSEYAGASLLPLMRGESIERPPIFGEQTGQEISPYVRFDQQIHPDTKKYMVITQDGFKLIYNREANSYELFDLNSDPKELRNQFNSQSAKAAELRILVSRFVDIVTALRPWDADEGRYSRAGGDDGDKVEQ
jgi:arylsulfatase A-like enzyme